MFAITMMFWVYDYQHVQPSGAVPRRGEQLTFSLLILEHQERSIICNRVFALEGPRLVIEQQRTNDAS